MKRQKIQIICSPERLKEIMSGPGPITGFLTRDEFQIPYYDTIKIDGITLPEKFPKGMKFFEAVKKIAKDYIKKFPNCCESHKKLIGNKWFKKSDYDELPNKVIEQLYYTTRFMETRVMDEFWLKDVKDYIEHNILSFGQLPEGYGNSVGVTFYENNLKKWIDAWDRICTETKELIKEFIDNLSKPIEAEEDKEESNLNLLFDTYKKWLSVFPFEIDYFQKEKYELSHLFPLFVGNVEYNRFIGTVKGKVQTMETLISSLLKMTNYLLGKVDSTEMIKQGLIVDVAKHKMDLINEAHRLNQTVLLKEFSESEKIYVDLLNRWLQNEKEYFKEIGPLIIKDDFEIERIKTDKIRQEFLKYGFGELPLVKRLGSSQLNELFTLISQNDLPYRMAMIQFLGFIDYLLKNHFKSQHEVFKYLARWFKFEDCRGIKGNFLVLNPKSKENRRRYTAHLYKEDVEKDYQKLK